MTPTVLLVMFTSAIAVGQNEKLSESQKIEQLIGSIENLAHARFQRNGSYYTAKAAADHLRMKWKKAGGRIRTARDFIDKIASASSMTGKPYTIRWDDGNEIATSQYLYGQLEKLSNN